jgi:signal transduction histidine kinase
VGLGLALAREAAIQHGGNIVARNTNPGLRITVTLPVYSEEQPLKTSIVYQETSL